MFTPLKGRPVQEFYCTVLTFYCTLYRPTSRVNRIYRRLKVRFCLIQNSLPPWFRLADHELGWLEKLGGRIQEQGSPFLIKFIHRIVEKQVENETLNLIHHFQCTDRDSSIIF